MSIANLINSDLNNNHNIKCKEINCKDVNCVNLNTQNLISSNLDVDSLFVKNIVASLPDTDIKLNSNTTLLNSNLKITDDITSSDYDCQLVISSNDNGCLYIEADRDNIIEDRPYILGTADAKNSAFSIEHAGTPNQLDIISGSTGIGTNAVFAFKTAQLIQNTAPNMPTWILKDNLLVISNNDIKTFRNFNMVSNNIININDCEIQNNLDVQGIITNSAGDIIIGKSLNFQSMYDAFNINNLVTEGNITFLNTNEDSNTTKILTINNTDEVRYKNISDFGNLKLYASRVLPVSNYSTTSLTFVVSGGPLVLNNLPAGDYILNYSCELGNSGNNTYTEAILLQNNITTVANFGKGKYNNASIYQLCGSSTLINIPVTINTTFEIKFLAQNNTAFLRKYTLILYQVL